MNEFLIVKKESDETNLSCSLAFDESQIFKSMTQIKTKCFFDQKVTSSDIQNSVNHL